MTNRRSRLELVYDILSSIQNKGGMIKPTHLMYKSNLSHQMMEEYLTELISKDFINEKETKSGKTYTLTKRGFDYLSKYKVISEFIESFDLNHEKK